MVDSIRFVSPPTVAHPHLLKSKVHFDGFEQGVEKWCLIQKMSCGRFSVMSQGNGFYKVFADQQNVEDSFYEVFD